MNSRLSNKLKKIEGRIKPEENNKFFFIEGEADYDNTTYTIKDFLNSYPQYSDVNIINLWLISIMRDQGQHFWFTIAEKGDSNKS